MTLVGTSFQTHLMVLKDAILVTGKGDARERQVQRRAKQNEGWWWWCSGNITSGSLACVWNDFQALHSNFLQLCTRWIDSPPHTIWALAQLYFGCTQLADA